MAANMYPARMSATDKAAADKARADQARTDKILGMGAKITRRDFLDGVLISAAATTLPAASIATRPSADAPQDTPGYYPPLLTGMRGSHPGSFEAAHALRDGTFWESAPPPSGAEQDYDLVIVGAGMSGLAAAYFFRQARPQARILILDNHDDFGGHAKRNEFAFPGGRLGLINGGTLEIDSPRPYSAVADGLLRALGIDPPALEKASTDAEFYDRFGTQTPAQKGSGGGRFLRTARYAARACSSRANNSGGTHCCPA